jgi:hypothetical protein
VIAGIAEIAAAAGAGYLAYSKVGDMLPKGGGGSAEAAEAPAPSSGGTLGAPAPVPAGSGKVGIGGGQPQAPAYGPGQGLISRGQPRRMLELADLEYTGRHISLVTLI